MAEETYEEFDRKKAENFAEKENLDIVFPAHNQIQLDIDNEESLKRFERAWKVFIQIYPEATFIKEPSRSGKLDKYHITVNVSPFIQLSMEERLFFQASLGSDPVRELLGWKRYKKGAEKPTFFFKKKKGVSYPTPKLSPEDKKYLQIMSGERNPDKFLLEFTLEELRIAASLKLILENHSVPLKHAATMMQLFDKIEKIHKGKFILTTYKDKLYGKSFEI